MRLIDADEFIETAWKKLDMNDSFLPIDIKEHVLDKMPTIDAEPVRHGKWITDSIERNSSGVRPYYLFCSECHHSQYSRRHMPKYCPNCGAKMEEE